MFFLFSVLSFSYSVCHICQTVSEELTKSLAQGLDEAQIKQKAQTMCKSLDSLNDICDLVVDKYAGKLLTSLRSGQTPMAACLSISACEQYRGYRRSGRVSKSSEHNSHRRYPKHYEANGPEFKTEPGPSWSYAWHEDI